MPGLNLSCETGGGAEGAVCLGVRVHEWQARRARGPVDLDECLRPSSSRRAQAPAIWGKSDELPRCWLLDLPLVNVWLRVSPLAGFAARYSVQRRPESRGGGGDTDVTKKARRWEEARTDWTWTELFAGSSRKLLFLLWPFTLCIHSCLLGPCVCVLAVSCWLNHSCMYPPPQHTHRLFYVFIYSLMHSMYCSLTVWAQARWLPGFCLCSLARIMHLLHTPVTHLARQ